MTEDVSAFISIPAKRPILAESPIQAKNCFLYITNFMELQLRLYLQITNTGEFKTSRRETFYINSDSLIF